MSNCRAMKRIGQMLIQCVLAEGHVGQHRDFDQLSWSEDDTQTVPTYFDLQQRIADLQRQLQEAQDLIGVLTREEKRQKDRAIEAERNSRVRYGTLDISVDLLIQYKERISALDRELAAVKQELKELKELKSSPTGE